MFSVTLQNIGKKFYGRWLFRNLTLTLNQGESLALTGTNGSGKSTLMRIIAGQMNASEGKCFFEKNGKKTGYESMYNHISWTGPQITLYSDFSLEEHLALHFRFKKPLIASTDEMITLLNLEDHKDKKLRLYSSGMLQRVKFGMSLFSKSDILLLDEPTSNMDTENATKMLHLLDQYQGERILILASNLEREYSNMKILNLSQK